MKGTMKHLLIIPLLIASLFTSACDRSSILSNIQTALVIALAAAQVSGEVPPEYTIYIEAVLGGLACQSREAASTDSASLKATRMTACLTGVLAPVLPPGTPQDLVKKVHNIADALQRILSGLPPPQAVRAQSDPPDIVPSADSAKLLDMAKQAEDARARMLNRL